MTQSQPSSSQPSGAQPSGPALDPAALWSSARRLHPIYAELAREFVIEVPACADLEAGVETPAPESIEHAQLWLNCMDEKIQVHQLRQFLQTSSLVDAEGLVVLLQHFLKAPRTDSSRDKIDFLLVQYFSQSAPTELEDNHADLAYVAQGLEPLLGTVERPCGSRRRRLKDTMPATPDSTGPSAATRANQETAAVFTRRRTVSSRRAPSYRARSCL